MDRAGTLPDRCIACNAAAEGYRLARKLYWSPLPWRLGAFATPFAAMGAGIAFEAPLLAAAFWPLVLVLMIVHAFVRKTLKVELGVCRRHRRLRLALRALSFACIAGVVAAVLLFRESSDAALMLLWASLGGVVVLSAVQTFAGVQAVSVRQLDAEHAWLAGAGRAFRAALPEQPG